MYTERGLGTVRGLDWDYNLGCYKYIQYKVRKANRMRNHPRRKGRTAKEAGQALIRWLREKGVHREDESKEAGKHSPV